MNANESRTLWISIGAALFAIFLLYSWSQEQKEQMARKFGSTKRVVVAKSDIAEMATVNEGMLDYVDQPVDFLQPEHISEVEEAIGQVAAAPIKKGEQLLKTKLLLPGPYTGLSFEVAPGKRAIPIPVDDMRGVARLLKPGDRIDIVAALDYGKGAEAKREVRTILQDVVILATGVNIVNQLPRRFELEADNKTVSRTNLSGNTNFTSIIVEVKPDEAQQLVYILATSPGSLFTTLRHPNDRAMAPLRGTSVDDVLGKPNVLRQPAQAEIAPPPPPVVQPKPQQRQPQKRRNGFEDL
jgi:pilus assembly protein CpaB